MTLSDEDYFIQGRRQFPKYIEKQDQFGDPVLVETAEWREFKKRERENLQLPKQGITLGDFRSFEQYHGADAAQNLPKLRRYVDDFDKTFKHVNLYLWSHANGTQKTTIAKIVAKELFSRGFTVRFVLMGDLIYDLSRYSFEEDRAAAVDALKDVQFLIIDDCFDLRKATIYKSGYQLGPLDMFLRRRTEERRLATCYTSNCAIDEIPAEFGDSLRALVKRSVPSPMQFSDHPLAFDPDTLWKD